MSAAGGAAGAPTILPYGVALPEQSSTKGGSTTAPTPFGATPANPLGIEAAPRAAQAAAGQDIVKATQAGGEAAVGATQPTVEGARHAASQALENRLDLEKFQREQDAREADVRARKLDLQQQTKDFKFNDWYDTASTGNRVLAAIASGLLSGGTGQYHNVAKEMADSQHQKQLDQLAHLEKQLTDAGADEREVHAFGQESRANLAAIHAGRLQAIAAETQAQAARYNTPAAKAAADLASATARQAAASKELESDAGLRSAVGKQHSETKNTNAKPLPDTTPAGEKGAEADMFGAAVDAIHQGMGTLRKSQAKEADGAVREILSKTKATGEGEAQVQNFLGESSPIGSLSGAGVRSYARGMAHVASVVANKNHISPLQAFETLLPHADATPADDARALHNLTILHDGMTPAKQVFNGKQRGLLINGKVIPQ